MSAPHPLIRLGQLGQSPWLDFITRDLLTSGTLRRMIEQDGLRGMTTNPTIFEKAVGGSDLYDADIRALMERGLEPAGIFEAIAVADVRQACDLFRPLHQATGGADGFVSIEVSPELAYDTGETLRAARRLWAAVDRPNVMIKIPGTKEGLPAVERALSEGINVNITLLFSVDRYEEVIAAYLAGVERQPRAASVASFFVSRVDTKLDPKLPPELRGTIAIANAVVAYEQFGRAFSGPRWERSAKRGARVQRPLWASTSAKDPAYSDVHYVEPLVAPHTVNTLPPDTFAAYKDHGAPRVTIHEQLPAARARLAALTELGIDLGEATRELEKEGVAKFAASYAQLLGVVGQKAALLGAGRR
ncbi:MAG: transaldolase [Gemmatimonadales bacterium]